MKHVIIGTSGHIDHGKTTLIKALTGRETDKLDEEKNTVTFYDESEKIVSLPLEDLDSSRIQDVIYTDFVAFKPNQTVIRDIEKAGTDCGIKLRFTTF